MEQRIEDKSKGTDAAGRAKVRAKVIREIETLYKNRVGKFARIADPAKRGMLLACSFVTPLACTKDPYCNRGETQYDWGCMC